jgi:hypothetical protein
MQTFSELGRLNLAPLTLLAPTVDLHTRNAQHSDQSGNTKELCPAHEDLDYYLDAELSVIARCGRRRGHR